MKHHTKNSYSGWSKRCTRGYPSDYDGWSHQWEDSKPSDATKDNEGAAEVENEVEVDVVESRDRNLGCADAENAAGIAQVSKACDSAKANAAEKDTSSPPHQPKGKSQRNKKKNADANTKACNLNHKNMQALDTLAEEYEAFEVCMTKGGF